MELQLNKLFIGIILLISFSCSLSPSFNGDWSAMDEMNNYSELNIGKKQIRIYSEIGGMISPQIYFVHGDSLFTNILNYRMDWITKDSLVLKSDKQTFYLKRINKGFKLGQFSGEKDENDYLNSFYRRMNEFKKVEK
mgnify:CR=1 FL=1